MSLDRLLAALEQDARAQAERVLAEARAEAERVTREGEERTGGRRRERLDARAAECRASAAATLSETRRLARQTALDARQRLLARVFDGVASGLSAAAETGAYRTALPRYLAEALAGTGGAPAVIRCPPALLDDCRRLAAGRPGVTVVADPAVGAGFRVVTTDGAVEIDGTLEARLAQERPRLALAVLRALEANP